MKEIYSSNENTSELFEIEGTLHDLRQGDSSLTLYFNMLSRYWQQVDMFEQHEWFCPDDVALYKEIVQKKKFFMFFKGLNKDLNEVRGRILGTKALPSIEEAFSEVCQEESRRKMMLGPSSPTTTLENSALAIQGIQGSNNSENRQRKRRPWCDHFQKHEHTR